MLCHDCFLLGFLYAIEKKNSSRQNCLGIFYLI